MDATERDNTEMLSELVAARRQDETPIYGHFGCGVCGNVMIPAKRLSYTPRYGVRHIHYCKRCGEVKVEDEKKR